ncbi:hypothetical protein CI807_16740 [Pseudomonas sp. NS1(2017)]|nr:hypothetical protein CI807_16740 [Pseudomonas sp. NS1(2017)]
MNSSFFNSGVQPGEQELYQRAQALIGVGCKLTAEECRCCLAGDLLIGCCAGNSCVGNSSDAA